MKRILLLTMISAFVAISCASNPAQLGHIDTHVQSGSFEPAIESINEVRESSRGTWYNSQNDILFYLDRGMICHYAGLYQESFEDLATAEQLIEEAFTKSVTQDVASYILNDNTKDYAGEDYEDLYTNIFNALNYYHLGSIENAMVEIRRLNEKLVLLADKYQEAAERVRDADDSVDTTTIEASKFSNSALARYLGMLFYRSVGNIDGVRIEREELSNAFSLAPEVYPYEIPSSVEGESSIPSGMARLNVIAFVGLSPMKVEENIIIPLPFPPPNHSTRIALPVMVDRLQTINRVEVVLDSGERFDLELLENIGAVARETFKSAYSLTVLKSTVRAIARTTASAVGAQAANRAGGELAGFAAGLAGRAFSEAAEKADLRISRYFPDRALVGGINLEPGDYVVTVNFYGESGLVETSTQELSVASNALNLTQFACLR
jgi:hypothetical protein